MLSAHILFSWPLLRMVCTFIIYSIHAASAAGDRMQAQEEKGSVYYKR